MSNVKKLQLISPVVTILIVLSVSVLLLAIAGTGSTFAFVVEGQNCGLKVTVEEGYTDVSNLNPGDTKGSYLMVSNTGSGTFRYFFDIQRISSNSGKYRGVTGEPLEKILQMTVKRGEETLFKGLVTEFKELGMGNLAAGDDQQLDISVYFPETAGNEYQGADVTVRFQFRAVCEGGDDDNGGSGGDDDDGNGSGGGDDEPPPPPGDDDEDLTPPGDEGLEEPPETPGVEGPGEKEPPESQDVIEPDEPAVPPTELEVFPELPKTGEFSRPAIYGIGLLLVLAGLLLRKRALSRKQG